MSTITVWYTLGRKCIDIIKPSLQLMSEYEDVRDILILHTYSNVALGGELTSICPEKISEHWRYFGEGYENGINEGGYNQVDARNYILELAGNTSNEWLMHLDADEFFTDVIFSELREASQAIKIVTCSCYNFYSLTTAEKNSDKEHCVDGKYLLNPRDRIWKRGHGITYKAYDGLPGKYKNRSRHCGIHVENISKPEVLVVEGISLVHTHHMLEKYGWNNKVDTINCRDFNFSQAYLHMFEKYGNERVQEEIDNLSGTYKFVTDVYEIEHENKQIVYIPLRGQAFYSSSAMSLLIQKIKLGVELTLEQKKSDEFNALKSQDILTKTGYREQSPSFQKKDKHFPLQATILFTDNCNLQCTYCYSGSKASSEKRKRIDVEFIEKAVDTIVRSASERESNYVDLRYLGGGEPTLEWNLLQHTTKYAKKSCIANRLKLWIRLITNGTLLDEEKIEWLSENIDYITLSFDILPSLQAERKYPNGNSSYKKIENIIPLIEKYNIPYCFRSTITSKSIFYLEEMVKHAASISKVKTIRLEPLSDVGCSITNGLDTPDGRIFANNFFKARGVGKELGIDVKCKMSDTIDLAVARYCDAEFTISPDGIVTACHRYSSPESDSFDTFAYGKFRSGEIVFDIEKLNRILNINGKTFVACQDCFALWNCSGGCLSARTFNNIVEASSPHCDLTKQVLKGMIQERLCRM